MELNKMENPTITNYDCSTGETTVRSMTDDELKAFEERNAKTEEDRIKTEQAKADKAAAKASAQAKLAALGLTADEVTAIIGA
jgi:hypothetical protein